MKMHLLTVYVLKKFLRPFAASFTALCILIFISQLFDRMDNFLADGVKFKHVALFLVSYIPLQAMQMMPVACLLGTLLVVGQLSRTREYVAGLAGGLPPEKILKGLFIAGALTTGVTFIANEAIVPPSTHYARNLYREKIKKTGEWQPSVSVDLFAAGKEGRMWAIKRFKRVEGAAERVIIDHLKQGVLSWQVDAEKAIWRGEDWLFINGVERHFSQDGKEVREIQEFRERTFPFREKPADLALAEPQAHEMDFQTLKSYMRKLSNVGVPIRSLEVDLMMKLAFPFSCFVVIFLGAPLALHGKGNQAMGVTAAAILALAYLGFIQMGKALAQRVLPPWAGAWLANIVFMTVGAWLWIRMRRTA